MCDTDSDSLLLASLLLCIDFCQDQSSTIVFSILEELSFRIVRVVTMMTMVLLLMALNDFHTRKSSTCSPQDPTETRAETVERIVQIHKAKSS